MVERLLWAATVSTRCVEKDKKAVVMGSASRITVQQLSVSFIWCFEKECGEIDRTLQAYCHCTIGHAFIVSAPAGTCYDYS